MSQRGDDRDEDEDENEDDDGAAAAAEGRPAAGAGLSLHSSQQGEEDGGRGLAVDQLERGRVLSTDSMDSDRFNSYNADGPSCPSSPCCGA